MARRFSTRREQRDHEGVTHSITLLIPHYILAASPSRLALLPCHHVSLPRHHLLQQTERQIRQLGGLFSHCGDQSLLLGGECLRLKPITSPYVAWTEVHADVP